MSTHEPPLKEPTLLPKDVKFVITLEVKAEELLNLDYPPTRYEIYDHCFLSDSKSDEPYNGVDIEKFESKVHRGQPIEWVARLVKGSKEEFPVAIESVVYGFYKKDELEGFKNVNFFDTIAICGTKDKVIADIRDSEELEGEVVYIYNINFTITDRNGLVWNYSIDPRLKIER